MPPSTHILTAEPREISGRKVKSLRREGMLPANVFGSKIKSLAIQLPIKEFLTTYQEIGDTGLVYLQVKWEKSDRPALVHLVQTHPVSAQALHVDFRQVDLKEKITAQVPIELVGESPAVKLGGILSHPLDEIEVEALPTDFPEKLEIDISSLKEIGDSLHVSDLQIDSSKVTIKDDPEEVVAKVEAPKEEKEEEKPPAPEEVEATAQKGEKEEEVKEGEPAKDEAKGEKAE